MLKVIGATTLAALALTLTVTAQPAQARDGAVAAGVIGGLAVGAIVGSQINRDHNDYRDGSYRQRAYYSGCRIERRDYEDRWGRVHVRSVRVCD